MIGCNDFRRAVGIIDFEIKQQLRHVAPRRHGGLPRILSEAVVEAVSENDAHRVFTRMKHFRDIEGAVENPLVICGVGSGKKVVPDLFAVDARLKVAESRNVEHGAPDALCHAECAAQVRRCKRLVAASAIVSCDPNAAERLTALSGVEIFRTGRDEVASRFDGDRKIISRRRRERISGIREVRTVLRGDKARIPNGRRKLRRFGDKDSISILLLSVFVGCKLPRKLRYGIDDRTGKPVDFYGIFTYFHYLVPFRRSYQIFSPKL